MVSSALLTLLMQSLVLMELDKIVTREGERRRLLTLQMEEAAV